MNTPALDEETFKIIFDAIERGDWKLAAGTVLAVLVYLIRDHALERLPLARWGRFGKLLGWFKTRLGGVALAGFAGQVGAVSTALLARQPITRHLLLTGFVTALIGSGVFSWLKPRSKPKTAGAREPPSA